MKKINLDVNESIDIPNTYTDDFKIFRTSDGYFISHENNQYGPYNQLILDRYKEYNNDIFVYGWTPTLTSIFRNGVHGLELHDKIDTTVELIKSINKIKSQSLVPTFDQCQYLGQVSVYKLEENIDSPWVKEDGFTRKLLPNVKRLIYRTPENQVFVVNPDHPKPYSKYKKFDSYEELCIAVRRTGYDYGYEQKHTKVNNSHISSIVRKLKTNHIPDNEIQNVLNLIKNLIGIDTFRSLDFDIPTKITRHTDIDTVELLEELNKLDFTRLAEYINSYIKYGYRNFYTRYAFDYIHQNIIPNITSTDYCELHISLDDQEIVNLYPENEETTNAFNNPNLYNWKNSTPNNYSDLPKDVLDRISNIVQIYKSNYRSHNQFED